MQSRWISQYVNVPQTPLQSIEILKEESSQWPEITKAMSAALSEMRVDYDKKLNLRDINDSENPLLKKRKEKMKKDPTTTTTRQVVLPKLEETSQDATPTTTATNTSDSEVSTHL